MEHKGESYDAVLEKSVGFNNPNNISYLSELMGINSQMSFMTGLAGRFPEPEYSHELRQVQASKWAYRNVADGIDHFKAECRRLSCQRSIVRKQWKFSKSHRGF